MAYDFVITPNRTRQLFRALAFKDEVMKVSFDVDPWEEDNGTVTTVTWTVKAGGATISGQALASSVASALITFAESGGTLIQIKFTDGTHTVVAHLDILAKDPNRAVNDYGLCH